MDQSSIEKIRKIRALEAPTLKPSPFLREEYLDEFGETRKVILRDYQKQGVMNLLQVPRMVLGDDTGLGKTLIVLSAISYVWLVEPGFIPVVVTKKSALYQWAAEAKKFMTGMEVEVVDGEPYEREAIYRNFFGKAEPGRRKILMLTYETVFKDAVPGVVRDRSVKPGKDVKKGLKAAREAAKAAKAAYDLARPPFMESLHHRRGPLALEYADKVLKKADPDAPAPEKPLGWTESDDKLLEPVHRLFLASEAAAAELERWKDLEAPPMVTTGLATHVRNMLSSRSDVRLMAVFDEIHALKDYRGKIHAACASIADQAERVVGMTATPVKNRIMEFFAILKVVVPWLFPKPTPFMKKYCHFKMQEVKGGIRVPVVVGHSNEQLETFRQDVEAYYLSRRKYEVAKELPELITRELECRLSPEADDLYEMAEGLALDDEAPDSSADILRSLLRVQEASDAPQLVLDELGEPHQGESSKIEAIVDILVEQPDAKVLVFSQFERMVTLIQERLKKEGIKSVRITGKESDAKVREKAKNTYQDRNSGVNVMLITTAGSESINLQSTEHIVLVDTPWSWGDYVQLTGRAVRIGSLNVTVLVTHLVARRAGGGKTIDDHKISVLKEKKRIADKTAGEALKDGLTMSEDDVVREVFNLMSAARTGGSKPELREKARQAKASSKKVKAAAARQRTKEVPDPADHPRAHLVDIDLSDL